MNFDAMELNPDLKANVRDLDYLEPTPIQARAIPPILRGADVLGLAQTGTGKTAAFALPILQRLLSGPGGRIRALVLAPTRELADQIHAAFGALGRGTGLRGVVLYGGVGMAPQLQRLRGGVEVAVACPGRLLDHLGRGTVDLSHVEVVVIDEADRMFDMGFLPVVRQILGHLSPQRQTLLFSATMPADVRQLAADMLHNPMTIQVSDLVPVATVSHAFYPVAGHLKTPLLLELLRQTDTESVLVFTRTKHRARRVGEHLSRAGVQAASLQGNLSQNLRRAVLEGFRSGRHRVLVATDIMARGIDVSGISHVVNYDMPDTVDAYTHRIGRTGRALATGEALTLITREDGDLVRRIERVVGPVERRSLDGFEYAAPPPPAATATPHPSRRGRSTPAPGRPSTGPSTGRPAHRGPRCGSFHPRVRDGSPRRSSAL